MVCRSTISVQHTRGCRWNAACNVLVLVHSDGNDMAILEHEEVYATLAALKAEGKIRGFGFSGKTVEGGLKALEQGDCANGHLQSERTKRESCH